MSPTLVVNVSSHSSTSQTIGSFGSSGDLFLCDQLVAIHFFTDLLGFGSDCTEQSSSDDSMSETFRFFESLVIRVSDDLFSLSGLHSSESEDSSEKRLSAKLSLISDSLSV